MITGFKDCREGLMFCSDRTGVNELYIFNPESGEIIQKTNTKYGSKDHQWSEDRQYLYYTSQTMKGKHIFRTHADSLISRKVDFFERYSYPIAEKLAQHLGRSGKTVAALDELASLLGLPNPPEYIESYDISHTDGADNVAGMIVFKGGKPWKSAYRRFEIKGFSGQDDYRSMAEVLTRRFNEYEKAKHENPSEGFGKKPDLILLDGGIGQVNAVRPVLESFGLSDIPLYGMVKDNKHRTRAIAHGGGEIAINDKRKAFTLVADIQEEVHRFSVEYHRKKQKKTMTAMTLTEIEGVGTVKAKALLQHFRTLAAIRKATADELCEVEGISEKIAMNIYKHYHRDEEND